MRVAGHRLTSAEKAAGGWNLTRVSASFALALASVGVWQLVVHAKAVQQHAGRNVSSDEDRAGHSLQFRQQCPEIVYILALCRGQRGGLSA